MFSWKPFGSLLDAFWSALGTSGTLFGGSQEALRRLVKETIMRLSKTTRETIRETIRETLI